MGLLDDIRQEHEARRPNGGCTLGKLLGELSDEDRVDLQEALDLPKDEVSGQAISNVIERRFDRKIGGHTIQRHRRGHCACERD